MKLVPIPNKRCNIFIKFTDRVKNMIIDEIESYLRRKFEKINRSEIRLSIGMHRYFERSFIEENKWRVPAYAEIKGGKRPLKIFIFNPMRGEVETHRFEDPYPCQFATQQFSNVDISNLMITRWMMFFEPIEFVFDYQGKFILTNNVKQAVKAINKKVADYEISKQSK